MGLEGVDWTDLAQDEYEMRAVVDTVMNLHVPQNCQHFYTGRGTVIVLGTLLSCASFLQTR